MTGKAYPKLADIADAPLDPNSSYAKVIELVGSSKRVLDVGCASGYLARLLSARGCEVVGIDINPEAVHEAERFCVRTYLADLDRVPLDTLLSGEHFDAVIFADVLEHLRDPWSVLDNVRHVLNQDGHVVVSIPNIAHGAIRLSLLQGKFNYSEFGILDDSHLRFFTRRTLGELFVRTGYEVQQIERTVLRLFESSNLVPALTEGDFDEATVARVREDADFETLQFVVKAKVLDDEAKRAQLIKAFVQASDDLDKAREKQRRIELQLELTHSEVLAQRESMESLSAGLTARLAASTERELHLVGTIDQLEDQARQAQTALRKARKDAAELELALHSIAESFEGPVSELRRRVDLLSLELREARGAYDGLLARCVDLAAFSEQADTLWSTVAALRIQLAEAHIETALLASRLNDRLVTQLRREPSWPARAFRKYAGNGSLRTVAAFITKSRLWRALRRSA